ncbi:uncharacterized protein LOC110633394 [Hevea brasiliensis]|uniref:uncharacterized protein LOC110633394 n=1 Tax=Hevea brasiliensis TaxID=3981 RepID=UPI0025DAA191|nr:uncharacterized protein LOC110633394 [Hevea brasiliensis]
MAACHLRSISLPYGSHPLTATIEEHLYKLKASQSSSIFHKLSGLKNLYECVDDLLQLPLAQQSRSHERQSQCVENALNGSLKLLDLCDSMRDFFSDMKECVQRLELSLSRRKGGESGLTGEVDKYMTYRNKLNKAICKCLRNLKKKERNCAMADLDNNSNLTNMISMLRGVQEIGLVVFESILSFISQPKAKSTSSSCKDISISQLQNVLKGLEALESSVQEVEEELECIYTQLVKTRVSLLNILNH